MKSALNKLAAVCAVAGTCYVGSAASFTVDPGLSWSGFMNVFELPATPGGAPGAYQFGSGWGIADLSASWSGPVLTLSPNTIGDPNPYWYTPAGGPGATGNKLMDANMYVETTGVYTGQTVTFTGEVLANTLFGKTDANGHGWTSVAFVKDFAPDYSSSVTEVAPLVNGVFSVSLDTINDPARHIQFGFQTIGPNVWVTDVAQYGSIQITAVPEPSSVALLLTGLGAIVALRRRN